MLKSLRIIAVAVLAALWPAAVASAQFGFGIHVGGGHHYDHDPHFDHHDYYGHDHHSGWHHVVPHYDDHYDGSYYSHDGVNYYMPYVAEGGAHVAARPAAIEFGSFSHVDDLAGRLERLANDLCLDLHYNYRHNRGFRQTYREAYQIFATAQYIHNKEHQGDRAEVARRLSDLDGLFHHVESDVNGWSRRHVRQIGRTGMRKKLDQINATLHHLMNDVGVRGDHVGPEAAPAPADFEVAPTPAE